MREIKFRAWDRNTEEMVKPEHIRLSGDGDAGYVIDGGDTYWSSGLLLMQYTGLKDKNGVEIYEGDVLFDGHFSWTVVFEDAAFVVKCFSHNQPVNNAALPKILSARQRAKMPISVIGNIRQNPELLEAAA